MKTVDVVKDFNAHHIYEIAYTLMTTLDIDEIKAYEVAKKVYENNFSPYTSQVDKAVEEVRKKVVDLTLGILKELGITDESIIDLVRKKG